MMIIKSILFFLSLTITSGQAFVSHQSASSSSSSSPSTNTHSSSLLSPSSATTKTKTNTALSNSIVDTIQTSFKIAQESNAAGYGFKQVLADVLAGDDYDEVAIANTIEETIASAPCVMYTWESSPSCKKAIEAFETSLQATVKIVRLDDPWEEGNPVRAVLGKKMGRTSVPFIFVGGEYIGGFDGGIEGNTDASGMVDLAFQGKLREMLSAAGAMK